MCTALSIVRAGPHKGVYPLRDRSMQWLKAKTPELCDGNYYRNKTIQSWSKGIMFLIQNNRRFMLFPLRDHFIPENRVLD